MISAAQPIPDGFHTITPYLVVQDAAAAISFYKRAFDARELYRSTCERTQRVMNAKLRIGNSMLMLNDEFPEQGRRGPAKGEPSAITIHLYVENIDAVFDQAVEAGATAAMAPANTAGGTVLLLSKTPSVINGPSRPISRTFQNRRFKNEPSSRFHNQRCCKVMLLFSLR